MKRLILERKRDSMDYAMKVYPMHFENGKTEWCVEYPDLKGCVGGEIRLKKQLPMHKQLKVSI